MRKICTLLLGFVAVVGCTSEPEGIESFKVGDSAPDLGVAILQGAPVALGEGDNVHIIEFWATWCAPCKDSAPHLSELQNTYGDQGLVVLGISEEEESVVKPYLAEYGADMAYTIALDPEGLTQKKYLEGYGIQGIPWAFLVDREGKVAWVGHPMAPELETELKLLLDSAAD
jgi:thiol-disulfide isomerase/thioredoxin